MSINPQFFTYGIPVTSVAAGSVVKPQISFSNDCDFLLTEIRVTKVTSGAILMQLSISNGTLFSNTPLDTTQFAEDNFPMRFADPVRISASSDLTVQLENTTVAAIDFQVQLWGYKVERLTDG